MAFAIFGIISIIACLKWGDWRHWQLYYPTVLYILIGDLVTDYLLYGKGLWAFCNATEKYPALDMTVMLLIYPSTVILFLSHYPKPPGRQALYILMWAGMYITVEALANALGGFLYHNGWNLWYSLIFDLSMFPLLILHHRKPLFVWPISAVLCFALLWWFRVPLLRQ